jgi:hypothetical protein
MKAKVFKLTITAESEKEAEKIAKKGMPKSKHLVTQESKLKVYEVFVTTAADGKS